MMNVARINDDFREAGGEDSPSLCFYEAVKTRVGVSEVCRFHLFKPQLFSPSVEGSMVLDVFVEVHCFRGRCHTRIEDGRGDSTRFATPGTW